MPSLQEECNGLGPHTSTFGLDGRYIKAGLEWQLSERDAGLHCSDQTQKNLCPPDSCMSARGVCAVVQSNIETACHGNRARGMDVLVWSWPDCSTFCLTALATG